MRGAIEGKRAREYDAKLSDPKRNAIFDRFILKNAKGKSAKVCDFCCGPGNDIQLLKDKVGEITGIDISKEMIKICREKFGKNKKIHLQVASVTGTGLKSDYFDYVIMRMGLHHVKDKAKVLEEARRILRQKGKLIIIDKYYLSLFELYWKGLKKLILQGNPAVFEEFLVSKQENERLFSASRFKIVKKKILPYDEKHVGQAFMCVLKKNIYSPK